MTSNTNKQHKGGRISMPIEYYGKSSGKYTTNKQQKGGRISMPIEYYGKSLGKYTTNKQQKGGRKKSNKRLQ
jgi:uncharacterized glyoxalase superfamily protein PhnB